MRRPIGYEVDTFDCLGCRQCWQACYIFLHRVIRIECGRKLGRTRWATVIVLPYCVPESLQGGIDDDAFRMPVAERDKRFYSVKLHIVKCF